MNVQKKDLEYVLTRINNFKVRYEAGKCSYDDVMGFIHNMKYYILLIINGGK